MRSHPTLRRIRPANVAAFVAGIALVLAVNFAGPQTVAEYLTQAAVHTRVIFLVIVACLLGIAGLGSAILTIRHLEQTPRR